MHNSRSSRGSIMSYREDTIPTITAEPRIALRDEKINIELHNFPRNEKITLHGQHIHGKKQKITLASCGHYVSDDLGRIRVSDQPSIGGTYTGLEPMGVIWSLQRIDNPRYTEMYGRSSDIPRLIELKTYKGHLQLDDIYESKIQLESLADVELERWLMFPSDVTKTDVQDGNVRGSLFLPKGDGPFQGVIDMHGSGGGIVEYRAALFASRGFATLALAFFGSQGTPKELCDVSFDYFEEATSWLSSHPKVFPNGIGVVALSKSVQYAYCMSAYLEQIKCVVAISGTPCVRHHDLYYKGKLLHKGYGFELDHCEQTEYGEYIFATEMATDYDVIPTWRGDAKHLILVPEDDCVTRPELYNLLLESCPEEKKENFTVVKYPNAGHLLDPPYNPPCTAGYHPYFNIWMIYGGQAKEHAGAQEDMWPRILDHLRKHIPTS